MGGPVTLCSHTIARGVRGHAPPEIFDKNWVSQTKYAITKLKINNFKEKNQQEKLIAIFLSHINLDEHVSIKINISN